MRTLPTIVVSLRSVIFNLTSETLKRARKHTVNSHVDYMVICGTHKKNENTRNSFNFTIYQKYLHLSVNKIFACE